jgi:hypothetical protein
MVMNCREDPQTRMTPRRPPAVRTSSPLSNHQFLITVFSSLLLSATPVVAQGWKPPRTVELVPALPRLPNGRPDRRACVYLLGGTAPT